MNFTRTTAPRSVSASFHASRGHKRTLARIVSALMLGMMAATAEAGQAEDWQIDLGLRYWYSTGEARKDLHDSTGTIPISRLTYDDIDAHTGEVYFRMDYGDSRLFIKGYAGLGGIVSGNLKDEDFEPVISPYSSTDSEQDKGWIGYASLDFGYNLFEMRQPGSLGLRLGAFAGYHYFHQKLNAYGCEQTAGNDYICKPYIPTSVKVITQDNDWHSLRLGLAADLWAMDRVRMTLDAAYTYSWLDGKDHHWLRPSINPVPEDGHGHGFQLEGVISYRISDDLEVGLGGRYWQFGRIDTKAHFEDTPGGGITQQEEWKSTRYGVFLQANWRF